MIPKKKKKGVPLDVCCTSQSIFGHVDAVQTALRSVVTVYMTCFSVGSMYEYSGTSAYELVRTSGGNKDYEQTRRKTRNPAGFCMVATRQRADIARYQNDELQPTVREAAGNQQSGGQQETGASEHTAIAPHFTYPSMMDLCN